MKKLDAEPRLQGAIASVVEWARKVVQAVNTAADELAKKAPLNSPALTGTPTVPTPASTDNSTRIATTAFVKFGFAISLGSIGYVKFPDWLKGVVFEWGTSVVMTDGGGNAAIFYPMAYPNATMLSLGWNGDSATGSYLMSAWKSGWPTASGFAVNVRNSTTGANIASTNVRVDWISVGW